MPNVRKVERPAKSVKRRVDRRVGRTRARLGQALRKLMEQRPLEKISVQDVIELAGVSRSAFYAHYDGKVDLLLSDMDEFLERMAMLLVVRSEQSNRIAPVQEFFTHVGEAEEIRGALARSERLQDFFDLAVEHFARGIELRLRQLVLCNRYGLTMAARSLGEFQGASEAPVSAAILVERATRKFAQRTVARRGELKMARRLRCFSVTGRRGHARSSRLGGGPF